MGWLTPEITAPVTLKLTADDVRREAFGRILSLTGAAVGLIGGGLILAANPALKGAVAAGQGQTITLSVADAKKSALGKSLALIGTGIGVAGSLLVMSSNPKSKAKFASAYDALPAGLKTHKNVLMALGGAAVVGGIAYMLKLQNSQYAT
jgi:hypothetical protein